MHNNLSQCLLNRGIEPESFKPTDSLLEAFQIKSRKLWYSLVRGDKELTHRQAARIAYWLSIPSENLLPEVDSRENLMSHPAMIALASNL